MKIILNTPEQKSQWLPFENYFLFLLFSRFLKSQTIIFQNKDWYFDIFEKIQKVILVGEMVGSLP